MARIVSPVGSDLGVNNITVESKVNEVTPPFERNGFHSDDMPTYSQYTQSTPTARGQFASFIPPGNLIESCLDGTYSSTSGLTFVYMRGGRKGAVIYDTTNELDMSALNLSDSNQEIRITFEEPRGWNDRLPVSPFVYIDDTNGVERLGIEGGVRSISSKRQKS